MAKKMSAIVLAAVMSVTLLAGCGSKGTDTAAAGRQFGSTDHGKSGEYGMQERPVRKG